MFSQDFKELLSAFNAHRVKYLIVGAMHSQLMRSLERAMTSVSCSAGYRKWEGCFCGAGEVRSSAEELKPEDLVDHGSFF